MDEVPPVAEEILEDRDRSVGLVAGLAEEAHAVAGHAFEGRVEVLYMEEQSDPVAELASYEADLVLAACRREQQASRRAARPNDHPALR
ncbi:MAG TPA: hypothetical protein VGZ33_05585, partial [Acidimicrobiales bacterium]|nr:hypothetical protein [Acidimicrobiales bacterium]